MAKKRARGAPLPMPIAPIEDVPGMASFPGGVYNAVITLAYVYWRGGCRPLPAEDSELMSLTRYAAPRWARSRDRVLTALQTLLPVLQSEHARLIDVRHKQRSGGLRAGAIIRDRFKALPRPSRPPGFSDIRTATTPTQPTTARPHENNRADMATRAAVIAGKRVGSSDARLSDAPKLSDTKTG